MKPFTFAFLSTAVAITGLGIAAIAALATACQTQAFAEDPKPDLPLPESPIASLRTSQFPGDFRNGANFRAIEVYWNSTNVVVESLDASGTVTALGSSDMPLICYVFYEAS